MGNNHETAIQVQSVDQERLEQGLQLLNSIKWASLMALSWEFVADDNSSDLVDSGGFNPWNHNLKSTLVIIDYKRVESKLMLEIYWKT